VSTRINYYTGTGNSLWAARNIRLEASRPVWLGRCEQCWSCFHHPEIAREDIVAPRHPRNAPVGEI